MQPRTAQRLPIHEEFTLQAQRTPQQIAIKAGTDQVSYSQLERRANAVASHLMQLGVRAGDCVGLHMSRSIEIIIAKLAILKCGAAYLPLDKANPTARNLHCIAEAAARVVITDTDAFADVPQIKRLAVTAAASFAATSDQGPQVRVDPEDRAYVMFTSGSTGAPKGVVVPHRGIHRLVKDTNYIEIRSSDAILQMSSLSFDAATFEVWGALLNGATLVLYPGTTLDPNLFATQLRNHGVSIVFLTTALFHIMATRFVSAFAPLRVLLTGGDVLYPALVNKVADDCPDLELIICYGPTENTSFTTTHRISAQHRPTSNVPIGRAITGTEVHVLDEALQPVAAGEVGELFVSGPGTALGYLNRGESRDDFFRDARLAAGLIYRTGDLVRHNPQGDIEFVGRRDNQVKIRGFRASLEEIQALILKVQAVQDAIVLLQRFESGDQQLVAYLQLAQGATLTAAQIKQRLAQELPPYMIPDRIHVNVEYPININGKVCRSSLRAISNLSGEEVIDGT